MIVGCCFSLIIFAKPNFEFSAQTWLKGCC